MNDPILGASHQQSGKQEAGVNLVQSINPLISNKNSINNSLIIMHHSRMIVIHFFVLLICSSLTYSASIESEISSYSNYIWRGTTFSENRPVLQLTVDGEHNSGFFLSGFFSNAEFSDPALGENSQVTHEVDLSTGKRWISNDLELQVAYNRFLFPGAEIFEAQELNVYLNIKRLIFELSYMDTYFGYEGAYKYIRIGYEWIYTKTLGGTIFVGYNMFDNPKGHIISRELCASCGETAETTSGAGNPNYVDIYFSNRKTLKNNLTLELALNWTNRSEYFVEDSSIKKEKARDFAAIIGMSLPFNI